MAGAEALRGCALDRRLFLGLAGAAALARPVAAAPGKKNRLIVNALGGLSNPNDTEEGEQGQGRTIEKRVIDDIRASGCDAINVTLGYVAGPDEPFEATVADIGKWDARIRNHPRDLLKVLAAADILRARDEGRIGLIYGFQNAAMLGDKVERVEIFHDLGVRIVQLTYNPANTLGDGSMASQNRGLTEFGRKAIEALNAKKIMVDLSHSGERTCLEAAAASKQPISINHTGCRALTDLPRNKTDEELRLVASRGGFIGIYFMPFLSSASNASAADVVAHIDHAVNVCGEDHVGIGTDGPITGVDDMAAYRARAAKEVARRRAAGIGATGENPDTIPMVADLQGPGQFERLAGLLKARGHSEGRIDKILGFNFLSYARRVWGA
jgi:membrane dipeptidase